MMPTKNELEDQNAALVAEIEALRAEAAEREARAEAEAARLRKAIEDAELAKASAREAERKAERRPSLDAEPSHDGPKVWVEMTPYDPHVGRKSKRWSVAGAIFDSSAGIEDRCHLLPVSVAKSLEEQRDVRQRGTAGGAVMFVLHDKRPY